ncbi:unnamed protein product [Toxocara canis]|nr:unnamed protein product [Toxocara canis]
MWGHVGRLAKFIHDAEFYAALIELCVTTILYMAVVLALVSKRRFVSITRSSLQHCELRILIQAMTISFFIGFVLFTWYNFDSFFIQTKWTFFLVNMMWILNCGINPILYLVLNR